MSRLLVPAGNGDAVLAGVVGEDAIIRRTMCSIYGTP